MSLGDTVGGLDMSPAKTPLSQKPLYTGHLKGKRERGRPKNTWRWTVEKEILEMGEALGGVKLMAIDGQMWREHVAAPHAT